jgi:hypothetical protein
MEELVWFLGQAAFETALHLVFPFPTFCKVLADTPDRLVVEYRLPPGAEAIIESLERTQHVLPRTDARLALVTWQGDAVQELKAGVPFRWRAAYVHSASNASDHDVVFEITVNKS